MSFGQTQMSIYHLSFLYFRSGRWKQSISESCYSQRYICLLQPIEVLLLLYESSRSKFLYQTGCPFVFIEWIGGDFQTIEQRMLYQYKAPDPETDEEN